MLETTTRIRGLYGQATFGSAAKGTQYGDGGTVRSWELGMQVEEEDARALSDFGYVSMPTGQKFTFRCEALIVTDAILTQLLVDPVMYVALYQGRAMTATTGTGTLVAQGMVVITGYTRANQRGPVLINVEGVFTGTVAQT